MAASPPVRDSVVTGPALLPLGHHEGKPPIRLIRPVSVIGSRSNARIHLLSSTVSKAHALLVRSNGRTYIRDLASRGKVYINGEEVREADLEDADLIKIGSFTFKYIAAPGEGKLSRKPVNAVVAPIPAKLNVLGADLPVPIDERVVLIGRRSVCDVHLLEESVSTAHAVIFEMNGHRFIRDLGSRTGTFVNNVSTHQHQLSPGDTIRIGETEMRYEPAEVAPATPSPAEAESADVAVPGMLGLTARPEPFSPSPAGASQAPLEVSPADLAHDDALSAPIISEAPEALEATALQASTATEDVLDLAPPAPSPATGEVTATEAEGPITEEPIAVAEVEPPPVAADALPPADIDLDLPASSAQEPALEGPEAAAAIPLEAEHAASPVEPPPVAAPASAKEPETELHPRRGWRGGALADAPEAPEAAAAAGEAAPEMSGIEAAPPPPGPVPSPAPATDEAEGPAEPAVADTPAAAGELELAAELSAPAALPASEPAAPIDVETPEPAGVELPLAEAELPEPDAQGVVETAQGSVEILESTEPTPESALQPSADELALGDLSGIDVGQLPAAPAVDALTDTTFDRAVREFAGDELGEIVEPPAPAPAEPELVAPPVPAGSEPDVPSLPEPPSAVAADTLPAEPPVDDLKLDRPPAAERVVEEKAAPPDVPVELPEPPVAAPAPLAVEPPAMQPVSPAEPPASPAAAAAPAPWGANQDNFLGGAPLDLRTPPRPKLKSTRPPLSQTPIVSEPSALSELVHDPDDSSSAVAENPAAAPTVPPAGHAAEAPGDDEPLVIPPPPPRPRTPNVFRGARRKPRRDETIPPFKGEQPMRGGVTTSFDGLAMPPVREMDVFSQMSPPAADEDATPLGEMSDTATASPGAPAALTPMDQIEAEIPEAPLAATAHRHRPHTAGHSGPPGSTNEPPRGGIGQIEPDADGPGRQRVRPALPGSVEGTLVHERRASVTYAGEQTEAAAASVRRKYFRRVTMLIVMMLLLLAGAMWGVNRFLGVTATVEGTLTYKNVAVLNLQELKEFQRQQLSLVSNGLTREAARQALNKRHPEINPGFLDNIEDYAKVAGRVYFVEARPDMLLFRVRGKDDRGDAARVLAMMQAMYDCNSTLREQAQRNSYALEALKRNIEQYQKQLPELTAQIEKLRILGESRPTSQQLAELESQVAVVERAWNESVTAVKASEAELARMKSELTDTVAADGAAAPGAALGDDEKLKAMQSQLDERLAKLNAARAVGAEQAANAKKALDAALDAFQNQVADAQGRMNDSPEIAAYIESARKLQETTRQLTDDLMRRQEQQFGRLTELKSRLNEKMEQRRIELWKSDTKLQELTEQQAMLTRQLNTALGSGLQKEAEDLKVQVELTDNMIKARQDLLPGDSFYAEAIQQLQVIIDSTRKNIDEDRTKTEQLLTTLQQGFTSNQSVEKLPAEQKQLASALQKQLSEINAARQQYNQMIDASASAEADSQLKAQVATLQAGIEARRKELADQDLKTLQSQQQQARLAAIEQKQSELSKLNEAEVAARKVFFDRHKELRDAQALLADAKVNAEKLDELIRQKGVVQNSLEASIRDRENKQRDVNRSVEPEPPADSNIAITRGDDKRWAYMAISCAIILAVFGALIVWTFHSAWTAAPRVRIQAADLRPVDKHDATDATRDNGLQPAASSGGNGSAAPEAAGGLPPAAGSAGGSGAPEDRQPAVV